MSDKFRIHHSIDTVLSKYDLWSDEFMPSNPSISDVLSLIRHEGGMLQFIEKRNLHTACGEMAVTVIPGDKE